MKCTVNCGEICYSPCPFRISPQRAEAIKSLFVSSAVCGKCGKVFIEARHQGKIIRICGCRVI